MATLITKFPSEVDSQVSVGKLVYRLWPDFDNKVVKANLTIVLCQSELSNSDLSGLSIYFPFQIDVKSLHSLVNDPPDGVIPKTTAVTSKPKFVNESMLYESYDGIPQVLIQDVAFSLSETNSNSKLDLFLNQPIQPGENTCIKFAFEAVGIFNFYRDFARFYISILRLSDLPLNKTTELAKNQEIRWMKSYEQGEQLRSPGGIDIMMHFPSDRFLTDVSPEGQVLSPSYKNWLDHETGTSFQVIVWRARRLLYDQDNELSIYNGGHTISIAGAIALGNSVIYNNRRAERLGIAGVILGVISIIISLVLSFS